MNRILSIAFLGTLTVGCAELDTDAGAFDTDGVAGSTWKDGGNDNVQDGNNGKGNDGTVSAGNTASGSSNASTNNNGYNSDLASGERPGHRNGQRLKRLGWEGDDGSYQFEAWHDTLTGSECKFHKTGADTKHCLPADAITLPDIGAFSDTACTQPVLLANRAVQEGQTAIAQRDGAYAAYTLGDLHTGDIYIQSEGNCYKGDRVPFDEYVNAAKIDNGQFVAATMVID